MQGKFVAEKDKSHNMMIGANSIIGCELSFYSVNQEDYIVLEKYSRF